jgi:hypothetical protein
MFLFVFLNILVITQYVSESFICSCSHLLMATLCSGHNNVTVCLVSLISRWSFALTTPQEGVWIRCRRRGFTIPVLHNRIIDPCAPYHQYRKQREPLAATGVSPAFALSIWTLTIRVSHSHRKCPRKPSNKVKRVRNEKQRHRRCFESW